MTREEKECLLSKLIEIEEKNDIGNLTRNERAEFQLWIKEITLNPHPCDDRIREVIRDFDKKHPAFADYMREFNDHPISEIIEYMWDIHDLIEDIKYRLPNEEGEEE